MVETACRGYKSNRAPQVVVRIKCACPQSCSPSPGPQLQRCHPKPKGEHEERKQTGTNVKRHTKPIEQKTKLCNGTETETKSL
eukprot:4139005-Amphidinium_carterae.1